MANKSDKDLVQEARALLTKTAPKGKITNGADAYLFDMRGPSLLSALCDEVEAHEHEADSLRRDNKALGDGIKRYERELMTLREAAGEALRLIEEEHPQRLIPRRFRVRDQLRAALHPQPEETK